MRVAELAADPVKFPGGEAIDAFRKRTSLRPFVNTLDLQSRPNSGLYPPIKVIWAIMLGYLCSITRRSFVKLITQEFQLLVGPDIAPTSLRF